MQSHISYPVGKITEKAVCVSVFLTIWHCNVFLTIWHCNFSAELTKTPSGCFFTDFTHWVMNYDFTANNFFLVV